MTDKRFVDYFDKDHNYIIQDFQNEDEYQVGFVNCDEDVFLELINQLSNENEQLKKELYRVYDDDYYLKEFIMAIVTVFSSGNNGLSKLRYELIVDACEMDKTSLKEFFK